MTTIIFTKTSEKSFLKLPQPAQIKISKAIDKLEKNPLIGEKLKGEYEGQFKLYAWPYRVIYLFSALDNSVTILEIGHRQGIYKKG